MIRVVQAQFVKQLQSGSGNDQHIKYQQRSAHCTFLLLSISISLIFSLSALAIIFSWFSESDPQIKAVPIRSNIQFSLSIIQLTVSGLSMRLSSSWRWGRRRRADARWPRTGERLEGRQACLRWQLGFLSCWWCCWVLGHCWGKGQIGKIFKRLLVCDADFWWRWKRAHLTTAFKVGKDAEKKETTSP